MSRKKYMIGNWKMNQTRSEIEGFFGGISENYSCESWVSPQAIHLDFAKHLGNEKGILVGSQDCSNQESGAYTGQLSPASLKDSGYHFTLVGHSERRTINGEKNQLLNEKVHTALKHKLVVVYCVGESLEQRKSGETMDVVSTQIVEGLKDVGAEHQENLIIAYEPVWAIGTGETATPAQADEVHAHIRQLVGEKLGYSSDKQIILYGGSVKPGNVEELLSQPNVDGGLVGGASLKSDDYGKLCQAASK